MNNVVRVWKDEVYRQGFSAEELALLPENPAGGFELTDADLEALCGASGTQNNQQTWQGMCSQSEVCKMSAFDNHNVKFACISTGYGDDCSNNGYSGVLAGALTDVLSS